jgi:hypothetical protein
MKLREDPMARYVNNSSNHEGGDTGNTSSSSRPDSSSYVHGAGGEVEAEDDEGEESDPEAQFLATLTRREKMLLLRRLQVCLVLIICVP